jgi:hypothetical protein
MNLKKFALTVIGGCGAVALLGGCSSMLCGPTQSVSIDSKPQGAEVLVYDWNGEVVFSKTTPCVAHLDRGNGDYEHANYVVLVRKEGFAPVQIHLNGKVNRAYLLNTLNIVGFAIDPITHSMWSLSPDAVSAELLSENAAFFEKNKDGLFICLKEEVPPALTQYLKPVKNDDAPVH